MKISIASDHGGYLRKQELIAYLKEQNIEVIDEGTDSLASCDYPDYAVKTAYDVKDHTADLGIVICTTGIGVSIVCNKVKGIRAALVSNVDEAKLTRLHNDANVLALSAKFTDLETSKEIVDAFINQEFSNDERHVRRVNKIKELEEK